MRKDKRKLILEAACLAFSEGGYERTSIEKISRLAGVAQGLSRYYFNSKEKLYFEALCMVMKALHERLVHDVGALDAGVRESTRAFVHSYMSFTSDPANCYGVVYREPPFAMVKNADEMEVLGRLSMEVVHTLARCLVLSLGQEASLRVATYVVTSLHGVQRARFSEAYRRLINVEELADFFAGAVNLMVPPPTGGAFASVGMSSNPKT